MLDTHLASSVCIFFVEMTRSGPHPPLRGPLPRARGRLLEAKGVAGQGHGAEVADVVEDVGGLA